MTDKKAIIGLGAAAREIAQAVFDLALINAKKRLATIDRGEAEDNVEFDRAARTALALVRVAAEVDALAARKLKEITANDKAGAVADPDGDIEAIERTLVGRLSKYIDGYASQNAASAAGADGAGSGESDGASAGEAP